MLVIETNISYDNLGNFRDHQSRVIKVKSWDTYTEEIVRGVTKNYNGTLLGCNIPYQSKIENLKYDNKHLSCDIYSWKNEFIKKLAYRVQDEFELNKN